MLLNLLVIFEGISAEVQSISALMAQKKDSINHFKVFDFQIMFRLLKINNFLISGILGVGMALSLEILLISRSRIKKVDEIYIVGGVTWEIF